MKNIPSSQELEDAIWRKSTFSNPSGNCVEIAESKGSKIINGRVFVRDSKDPKGSILQFTKSEWQAFIAGAKDGEFDLETVRA